MFDISSILAVAIAGGVAWIATLALSTRAGSLGLLDHPHLVRKLHAAPTPVVGGIALSIGVVAAWMSGLAPAPPAGALVSFAMILALGVADDRRDLHWSVRFAGQAVAVLPMIFIDGLAIQSLGDLFGAGPLMLGPFAIPVTIFMALGAINALNMIDGSDGLAGGAAFASLVAIAAVAAVSGHRDLALLLAVIAAGVAGFLTLNVRFPWQPRAKAFLGNGGSELLGFVLAWAVIQLTQTPPAQAPGAAVAPILAPYLIGPVLVDCVAVMTRRMIAGRSPFAADTQHFHHMLQRAGASVTLVAATAAIGSLLFAGAGVAALALGASQTLLAAALVVVVTLQIFGLRLLERTPCFNGRLRARANLRKGAGLRNGPSLHSGAGLRNGVSK
jgi:UDP-GlcNAc:undecaprenyl-phosphate GlcNAc-1-phosphate transferase